MSSVAKPQRHAVAPNQRSANMDLSQAVAVVTGAGSGIGRELALQLARAGARLALNDNDAASLVETRRHVEELGGCVLARAFDVGSWEAMQDFAEAVRARYGQADLVINNAGVALGPIDVQDVSHADFQWIVNVNMWGVIHGSIAFLPMLLERPQAGLVNVSSAYGLLAVPGQAPYCATKFAVRGFTDSIRLELMDTNVCVTLVCPSQVKTNIMRNGRHKNEETKAEFIRKFDERMTKYSAENMAQVILDGVVRKRRLIVFGRDARILSFASRFAPYSLVRAAIRFSLRRIASY